MACAYSMIMDHYQDKWKRLLPDTPLPIWPQPEPRISQAELDEFRQLLERAREHDRKNGRPECELEEKKETLRRLAKQLGVEISFP